MNVRTDGYYISEGTPWVDWHAGHKFEGMSFKIFIFKKDNTCIRVTTKDENFDVSDLNGAMSTDNAYEIADKTIALTLNTDSNFPVKRTFTILSPEELLDENLTSYRFKPVSEGFAG